MLKKLTAMGMTVIMSVMLTMGVAFAEAEPTIRVSNASVEISAETETNPTVDISVSLENNPGIISMRLGLSYDKDAMTLVKVADQGVFGSTVHGNDLTANPYILSWGNDTASENFVVNDTIVVLSFEISKDAEAKTYSVEVDYDNENFDIFDYDFNAIDFTVVNGGITVNKAGAKAYSIETSDLQVGESISFKADITSPGEYAGKLIVAAYTDDVQLEYVYVYPAAQQVDVSFDMPDGISFVKLFWWDMGTMNAYCLPEKIEIK